MNDINTLIKKHKKKIKYMLIGIFAILILFCTYQFVQYRQGLNYLSNNQFEKAITKFEKTKLIPNKKEKIKECYYRYAKHELKKENYEDTIKLFNKSGNYKNSKSLLDKAYYLYAKSEIAKENYKQAIELLNKCKDYKDTNNLLTDTKYKYAISLVTTDYEKSKELLEQLGNYKDTKKYLKRINSIEKMIGGYARKDIITNMKIIVDTDTCEYYYYDNYHGISEVEKEFSYINDNTFKCGDTTFKLDEISITADIITVSKSGVRYKNVSFLKSDDVKLYEPKVNMTKEEVEKSTWGKPIRINKSTYSWGTSEQWVYSNNRYIYFDDGKVTSISE